MANSIPNLFDSMSNSVDLEYYERLSKVGRLITRTQTEIMDALDRALAEYGVSAAQWVVISLVARKQAESAAQICKELSYNPGAMTRMIDRLEQKGLIRRVSIVGNRRMVKLELTEEAQRLFPVMFEASASILERHYGRFSPEELEQLRQLLERTLEA
jgi:DNA-binding MarR family transcriptional regulator